MSWRGGAPMQAAGPARRLPRLHQGPPPLLQIASSRPRRAAATRARRNSQGSSPGCPPKLLSTAHDPDSRRAARAAAGLSAANRAQPLLAAAGDLGPLHPDVCCALRQPQHRLSQPAFCRLSPLSQVIDHHGGEGLGLTVAGHCHHRTQRRGCGRQVMLLMLPSPLLGMHSQRHVADQ